MQRDNETETPEPAKAGFFSPAKPLPERVNDAIEAWYGRHFHRASVEGRAPISTADKTDLVQAVAASIQTKE